MAVKVNCLNPIAACGMKLLPDTYEITDNYADADAVLVRSASMHDLELSDKLLCVARAGAGVNNIPLDKCAEKGVVVFNTPGANANGVKELVVAGLLLASRDLMGGYNWVKDNASDENLAKAVEKQKKQYAGNEIAGKKLGVIGLGAIGAKILEVAALVHDIGIKNSEKKYGYNTGKTQEKEGPPEAEKLLIPLTDDAAFIERVCYLVGHHHTYSNIDGMDYQILVEADFLVNLYEDKEHIKAVRSAYEKIFRTQSGRKLCKEIFALS